MYLWIGSRETIRCNKNGHIFSVSPVPSIKNVLTKTNNDLNEIEMCYLSLLCFFFSLCLCMFVFGWMWRVHFKIFPKFYIGFVVFNCIETRSANPSKLLCLTFSHFASFCCMDDTYQINIDYFSQRFNCSLSAKLFS